MKWGLRRILQFYRNLPATVRRRGFARNVATVATGTGAAIGINLLSAPILTRLYTPEEFGIFAAFLSVSSIVAVGAAGRYELAVVLADTAAEARRLVLVCLGLSLVVSALLSLAIVGFSSRLVTISGIDPVLLWLLPPFVLLLTVGQTANNWLNWSSSYVLLGYSRTARNGGAAVAQIALAFRGLGTVGLVVGRILGEVIFVLISGWRFVRENVFSLRDLRMTALRDLLAKHVRFPIYTLPSAFISKTNAELPEILLLALFEPRAAGLYALTRRAVDRPLGFVSNSVREVFYRRFADSHREGENMVALLTKTTLGVAGIVTPPIAVLMLVAPTIVVWVFGAEWRETADFIRVLAPAIAVHLVVRSTGLSMYVLEKQNVVLWWTSAFLVLSVGGLVLGAQLGGALLAVGLLAAVRVVMYVLYFLANLAFTRTAELGEAVAAQRGDDRS